jgi:hypothetical protein
VIWVTRWRARGTPEWRTVAYRRSVETSVYVHDRQRRRGIALYAEQFEQLSTKGYCNAYAGIALPSDASVALHRLVGFEPIGAFRRVGRKIGAWHDVQWLQRKLCESPPAIVRGCELAPHSRRMGRQFAVAVSLRIIGLVVRSTWPVALLGQYLAPLGGLDRHRLAAAGQLRRVSDSRDWKLSVIGRTGG